jgi:hypothetical protein
MKVPLMLASMFCLTACSGDSSDVASKVFPLQITRLAPATDPATGAVDVSVAVRNSDGYTLRSAVLTIAGYDAKGTRTGADFPLQIDGPLSAKDNSGVVARQGVWHDVQISCIEVVSAKVTSMDYATDYAQGLLARSIVAGHAQCHTP